MSQRSVGQGVVSCQLSFVSCRGEQGLEFFVAQFFGHFERSKIL